MTKPIHTPGPVFSLHADGVLFTKETTGPDTARYRTLCRGSSIDDARLLAAAYNAFDSAGRNLGWNAVLFAEAAQDGGIADLMDALISAERFIAKQSGGGETEFRASLLAVLRKVNPGVQA